jgi:nicotinamide-nucleotide adenylyltransferase
VEKKTTKTKIEEELVVGFKLEDVKLFNTGRFGHVFPVPRLSAHRDNIPHIIIRLFAQTLDGYYLVQKRSQQKKRNKGKWTDSASGHVEYKEGLYYEDIEATVHRELKEEMGSNLLAIRFFKMALDDLGTDDLGNDRYELSYIYFGIVDKEIKLDLEEVDERSGLYDAKQLSNFLKTEEWVDTTNLLWKEILEGKHSQIFNEMKSEIESKVSSLYLQTNDINSKLATDSQKSIKKPHFEEGLIIGRFQPFHIGHLFLIKTALSLVTHLKIGIGSSQFSNTADNPYSFDLRSLFIEKSLGRSGVFRSRYSIHAIPDQFDIYKWMDKAEECAGDFDVFFSNSLWTGRLFQLRHKVFVYGLKYDMDKYNGTRIRQLISQNNSEWKKLVPDTVCVLIENLQ